MHRHIHRTCVTTNCNLKKTSPTACCTVCVFEIRAGAPMRSWGDTTKSPSSLRYPLSVFNKKSTLKSGTVWDRIVNFSKAKLSQYRYAQRLIASGPLERVRTIRSDRVWYTDCHHEGIISFTKSFLVASCTFQSCDWRYCVMVGALVTWAIYTQGQLLL